VSITAPPLVARAHAPNLETPAGPFPAGAPHPRVALSRPPASAHGPRQKAEEGRQLEWTPRRGLLSSPGRRRVSAKTLPASVRPARLRQSPKETVQARNPVKGLVGVSFLRRSI
jgi:hypothetical protein